MSRVMELYEAIDGKRCACGKIHRTSVKKLILCAGAIARLPEVVGEMGAKRAFLLADVHTWAAAGEKAWAALTEAGCACSRHVFEEQALEPDEHSVGSAVMHFDHDCDVIVGVGSGVINDIGKILSRMSGKPYIIVGTAPSMDGYASATSSMSRDGLKVSLPTRCPDVIVGDLDVLCQAPERMLRAGLGDMLAKYVSICEWRIASLLVDEPYCETIASLVRAALRECVVQSGDLLLRRPEGVKAVFEGLVVCGAAMEFAGLSRPASGMEHYFSHVWDMRALAMGEPADAHGIQCAIGTLYALRVYEMLRERRPDREVALAHAAAFDVEAWNEQLRGFLGKGAEAMIAAERRDGKYDPARHAARLERIIERWDSLCAIMEEELPTAESVERMMLRLGMPTTPQEIGIDNCLLPMTFKSSKDIRDKYVASRMAWDLGRLEEIAERLCEPRDEQ